MEGSSPYITCITYGERGISISDWIGVNGFISLACPAVRGNRWSVHISSWYRNTVKFMVTYSLLHQKCVVSSAECVVVEGAHNS